MHKRSDSREWGSKLLIPDGLRERRREATACSQPLNKKGGMQKPFTLYIVHTLMVFLAWCVREHWLCWGYTFSSSAGICKYGEKEMSDVFLRKWMLQPPCWCLRSDLGPSTYDWAPQQAGLSHSICSTKKQPEPFINFNNWLSNLKWQSILLVLLCQFWTMPYHLQKKKRRCNADSKFLGKISLSEKGRIMPHIGLNKSLHWFFESESF